MGGGFLGWWAIYQDPASVTGNTTMKMNCLSIEQQEKELDERIWTYTVFMYMYNNSVTGFLYSTA